MVCIPFSILTQFALFPKTNLSTTAAILTILDRAGLPAGRPQVLLYETTDSFTNTFFIFLFSTDQQDKGAQM
jgi:hypothetical protein